MPDHKTDFSLFLASKILTAQGRETDIDGYRHALLIKVPKILLGGQEIKRLFAVNSLSISQSIS